MKQAHIYNDLVRCYNRSRRKLQRLVTEGKNLRKQNILQRRIVRLFKTLTGLQRVLKLGMATAVLSAGMLLFQPNAARSQITFGNVQTNPFGLTGGNHPAFADLDTDGDMDLLAITYDENFFPYFEYFQNTGTAAAPAFAPAQAKPFGLVSTYSNYVTSPVFADLDGDGDLDLMVGEDNFSFSHFIYFQNTGTAAAPSFAAPIVDPFSLALWSWKHSAPTFADLDGDGDLDMLSADFYGTFYYFQNAGTVAAPVFAVAQHDPFGLHDCCYSDYYATPAFVDLDRDGDFDVMYGEREGSLKYFENAGTAAAPAFLPFVVNPFGLTGGNDPSFADLHGDGDMDLMASGFWYYENTTTCGGMTVFADADGDGYGDAANSLFVADCIAPSGYVFDSTDCNDNPNQSGASIHPGACDALNGNNMDDNCDGLVDNGFGATTYYTDSDSDGYGTGSGTSLCSNPGAGYSTDNTDCNDAPDQSGAAIHPGAIETINGIDDDCDGFIDGNFWTQKADFGGTGRTKPVGFSINNKGYIGTGKDDAGYKKDFWEYDPTTDSWTQKADFGGTARYGAVGFSIGNKGYIGTGTDGSVPFKNDFWEYDPSINSWTQKSDFPGGGRLFAVGFSISNKGYLGTGYNYDGGQFLYNDFWEYNPANDAWIPKSSFPGKKREQAVGFSIENKGYIGTGIGTTPKTFADFWEYDPASDTWKKKADFAGGARYGAFGLSIGDKGYLGTKDFWEFNPVTNTWSQKTDVGGTGAGSQAAFSIGLKGYVLIESSKEFWEYTPEPGVVCIIPSGLTTVNITGTSAKLKWDNVADAKRYKVRYKEAGSSEWSKITDVKSNSKVISGLTPNTYYYWEVKSVCSANPIVASDWSSKASFTTGTFKVGDEQAMSLKLYPNPVSENFTLDLQLSSSIDQSATIFLLNEPGQIVYSSNEVTGNGELKKVITMPSTASSGWYVVRVVMNDQVMEKKLMYEK